MTLQFNARLAGLVYLLVVITGIFTLAYVPSQLFVWNDAAATVKNISNAELMFRLSIFTGLLCYVFFLILPLVFYKLLKNINKNMALLMVIFAVISVPISIFNLTNKLDLLTLLGNADYLSVLSAEQIQYQVMSFLRSYNNGILIVEIFWGLWLFPLGYLIYYSKFLPKFLGVLLILGSISYLIQVFFHIVFPEIDLPGFVGIPASVAEIGTCLWLLIMGAKETSIPQNA